MNAPLFIRPKRSRLTPRFPGLTRNLLSVLLLAGLLYGILILMGGYRP